MSCLNKHSAQLEEVWLGGSRLYVHVEVTSYTNWKTRRASLLFFLWKDCKWVPAAFFTTHLQETVWNGKKHPQEWRWLFQSYPSIRCMSPQQKGTGGERMGRAARSLSLLWGQHGNIPLPPFLPPKERNWSLQNTTDIFLAMQDTYVQCSRKLEMGISILT